MEALTGAGALTPWRHRVRNLACSSDLLLRFMSRQSFVGKSSSFTRFGPFASSVGKRRIAVQRSGAGGLETFRCSAKVGEETESSQDSAGTADASKVAKRKGFGTPKSVVEKKKSSPSAPASNIRRALPQKPLIEAQVDEETKQFETGVVASLAFLFSLIILEGIGLAASGFLPGEWDDFILKVIYPSFTPTVGVFLAGAAGYGVWKFFGLGEKKGPSSK